MYDPIRIELLRQHSSSLRIPCKMICPMDSLHAYNHLANCNLLVFDSLNKNYYTKNNCGHGTIDISQNCDQPWIYFIGISKLVYSL